MDYNTALFRLTSLCAGSEQCEWNLREKMKKWEVSRSDSDKIIDYLYDERYLDEQRFALAYARDKMRYNRWGRQKIDQNLRLLHVSAPSRKEALLGLEEKEYEDILQELLAGKVRTIKAQSDYERNGKLIRFALGRGFEMSVIMKYLPDADYDALGDVEMED